MDSVLPVVTLPLLLLSHCSQMGRTRKKVPRSEDLQGDPCTKGQLSWESKSFLSQELRKRLDLLFWAKL